MDKSSRLFLNQSRLVKQLGGLSSTRFKTVQDQFSERFGQIMDLSGSIALAATLEELPSVRFQPTDISSREIKDVFIMERMEIVRSIIQSFSPATEQAGEKLPTPAEYHAHCKMTGMFNTSGHVSTADHATAYEPYGKFYIKRQRNLSVKVHHLQTRINRSISGLSPEFAQLSKLDSGIGKVLSVWSGGAFTKIPKLLGKRFGQLCEAHWQELPDKPAVSDIALWMKPDGWIYRFCMEMRDILLAELDIRMQPVLGLIEGLG